MDGYVSKPIDASHLFAVIDQVVPRLPRLNKASESLSCLGA